MILSHRYKFIFFENGKTGSTAIRSVLEKYGEDIRDIKSLLLKPTVRFIKKHNLSQSTALPDRLRNVIKTAESAALRNITDFNSIAYAPDFCAARKHVPPVIAQERLSNKIWKSYFKFVFVRNPWDWVISNYCWNNKNNLKDFQRFESRHFYKHWEQMKRWRGVSEAENCFQYNWVLGRDGRTIVDFIGKFENLQGDFDTICDKIGLDRVIVPHLNRIAHKPYREYYTPETEQLVTEKYDKDIELLGYEF